MFWVKQIVGSFKGNLGCLKYLLEQKHDAHIILQKMEEQIFLLVTPIYFKILTIKELFYSNLLKFISREHVISVHMES